MLVLSRKVDEAILIGDDIKIQVLGVEDDRVRIGIDAPRSLRVFRMELLSQTVDVNKQASHSREVKFDMSKFSKDKQDSDDK